MPDIDNAIAKARAKAFDDRRVELEQLAQTAAAKIKALEGPRFQAGSRHSVKGVGDGIMIWPIYSSHLWTEVFGLTEDGQLVKADLIREAFFSCKEKWTGYYPVDLTRLSGDERSKKKWLQDAIAEG